MPRPACAAVLLAGLILAVLAPPASVRAEPVTIRHDSGETTLPDRPKKIAVFDLSALDTLDALGVPVAGVPDFRMPPRLARYEGRGYARIGTLFEPDYEAVSALEPDLIIVGGRSRARYAELSRIAPTVDFSGDEHDPYRADLRNITALGRIFGKEDAAAALIAKLDASVAALRSKAAGAGKGLFVLATGGRLSTYGSGGRFGILHDVFGIAQAAPDIKPGIHGQPISFEFIAKVDPDWLFVLDRDAAIGRSAQGQSAQALLDNELVARTKAWKAGQVVYLDAASWYLAGAGIRSLQGEVDHLAEAFARKR